MISAIYDGDLETVENLLKQGLDTSSNSMRRLTRTIAHSPTSFIG